MHLHKLEIIIQLCRMRVQRQLEAIQREKAMTPKLSGALESLKKLKSFADDEADKLTRRINDQTMPALVDAFKGAHATVDSTHSAVDEIDKFSEELKKTNGGDPLDYSEKPFDGTHPRSSEVASR